MRIPRNRMRVDASSARLGGHDDLSCSQLVELADNAVAGGARESQRGDERCKPDDDAENGQHHPTRTAKHSSDRLYEQIAERDTWFLGCMFVRFFKLVDRRLLLHA